MSVLDLTLDSSVHVKNVMIFGITPVLVVFTENNFCSSTRNSLVMALQ